MKNAYKSTKQVFIPTLVPTGKKERRLGEDTVSRKMSEYFLEKTSWQLNKSSQKGSELINSAQSRACLLFLWAQKPNLPVSEADSHINQLTLE